MISKLATIQGTTHTVIMPMVNEITSDLNKQIIKDKDAMINNNFMYDEDGVEFPDNIYSNDLGGSNIDISIDIEDTEVFSKTSSVYKPINKIIVNDTDIGLNIRQIYISTKLNLAYTYRCQSKEKMNTIINRLKLYYTNSGYTMIHNLPYSFTMPYNVIDLIKNINFLKNNNDNYLDYFNSIIKFKFDVAINRSKTYKVPTFKGIQSNIIGIFTDEPKSIKVDKGSVPEYSISFGYSVFVQKPMGLYIQYPIMVNNKKLEDIWLGTEYYAKPMLSADGKLDLTGIVNKLLSNDDINKTEQMIRIPTYDRFIPMANDSDNTRIKLVSMLLEIDNTDLHNIFNLDDLKYIGLPDIIINYLKDNGNNIFNFGESLFYIEIYEKDYIKDYGLTTDVNYQITTSKELKINTTYHILISILVDLNYINYKPNDIRYKKDKDILKHFNLEYILKKPDIKTSLIPKKFKA